MTVYKPTQPIAQAAAEAAMLMIQNKPVPQADRKINNGKAARIVDILNNIGVIAVQNSDPI